MYVGVGEKGEERESVGVRKRGKRKCVGVRKSDKERGSIVGCRVEI